MFTVVYIQTIDGETEVLPFKFVYPTREAAVQAIETDALEDHEYMVDPNDGEDHPFPGLDVSEDGMTFSAKDTATDEEFQWLVTEVAVSQ